MAVAKSPKTRQRTFYEKLEGDAGSSEGISKTNQMGINKAIEIIKSLSDGIDPYTGKPYPSNSPYQHPDTVRALFKAIAALENLKKRNKRQKLLPENAGKPWNEEEDNLLIKQFDGGLSFRELSKDHGRTEGAIKSRLVKLGKIKAAIN